MDNFNYYEQLNKPEYAPPASLFGPVWTVLYIIILISFGYVFYLYFKKQIPFIVVLPFLLNLFFNLIFTPIQFGLQNNLLALVDIFLVMGTIIWMIAAIVPFSSAVAVAQVPYLLWVSFATMLQTAIYLLNK